MCETSQELHIHGCPPWNYISMPSSPKASSNPLQGDQLVDTFPEWLWQIAARADTPFSHSHNLLNWQSSSFLLSPDRNSESLPAEHTRHMVLKDCGFHTRWNPMVIPLYNISLQVIQQFWGWWQRQTPLVVYLTAIPLFFLFLSRVYIAVWRLKKIRYFPSPLCGKGIGICPNPGQWDTLHVSLVVKDHRPTPPPTKEISREKHSLCLGLLVWRCNVMGFLHGLVTIRGQT